MYFYAVDKNKLPIYRTIYEIQLQDDIMDEVQIKVEKAHPNDFGRGIIRLDPAHS
jgi:hypothetical protein